MGQRSIPGFCERCGQRVELARPASGERDLGLDRIRAAFRYCAGCRLFVGRDCCWNPDAVACVAEASVHTLTTALVPGTVPEGGPTEVVQRAFGELASSIQSLEQFQSLPHLAPQADHDPDIDRQAWDEAWLAVGWLITRAETNRDAAARELWRRHAHPDPTSAEDLDDLNGQLASLDDQYARARDKATRLLAAARSLARPRRRAPAGGRWRGIKPAAIGAGAVAVAMVVVGAAAFMQPGFLAPVAANPSTAASQPEGAVLGATPRPGGSGSAAPSVVPKEPTTLVTQLDFDELRIGRLAGASDQFSRVAGGVTVVPFPSPFDRSVRFMGGRPQRFCLPIADLRGEGVTIELDLYAESELAAGELLLAAAPDAAVATSAVVALQLLGDRQLGAWHRLGAIWLPGQPAVIAIDGATIDHEQTSGDLPAHDARAVAGAVCVAVSGMAEEAVLLLDNLEVKQ
jgi:hypothetical protein